MLVKCLLGARHIHGGSPGEAAKAEQKKTGEETQPKEAIHNQITGRGA